MIEEYKKCASTCAATDYRNKKSVRRHNLAVDRMYGIIVSAVKQGHDAVSSFLPLLDDPVCARWLAHHLLEKADVPPQVEEKCLAVIEALSKGDGPDALGEQYWLRDYRQKKG
ncbi:MAG: hypothetical protein ABIK28_25645 [Planctomycetota bacterium]